MQRHNTEHNKQQQAAGSGMIKRDECGVLGRPPLIRKAEGTILAQNNMVKDGDADEVAGLTEPCREHTIFRTGLRIPGRMIVDADEGGAIQQDRRFEDFARMDDADRERANGHDVDADDGMFGVQTGDKELFPIETVIERPEYGCGVRRIADDDRRIGAGAPRHQLESVARNKERVRDVRARDDRECGMLRSVSLCHDGTSLVLDSLALSMKPESRCRTTGGRGPGGPMKL